jgi:hypothetical protein
MPEYTYHGQTYENGDGSYTLFDLQIVESPDSKERLFVIRKSPFNEGRPISDGLVVDRARKLADYYELKPEQVRLYAEMPHPARLNDETPDAEFISCRFREYSTGYNLILEFSAGEAKFPASKEDVDQHIDRILSGHKRAGTLITTEDLENSSLPSLENILKKDSGGGNNNKR